MLLLASLLFLTSLLSAGVPAVSIKTNWVQAGFSLIKKELGQFYAPSNKMLLS
jgi:hypothetical protein